MTNERKTMNSAELAKMLEVIPTKLKADDQEELCSQMRLVVIPDDLGRSEREAIQEQCQDVVQQMHDCMHNGPRVGGLVALNCLVMLDIILRKSVPVELERMRLYTSLLGLASKIGAMQGGGSPSERIH
jgi:hypothetical protein